MRAASREGVKVEIDSNGGIRPWDLQVNVDPVAMRTVRDALASPAYDFTLPPGTPAFQRARITIPYDESRLGTFPEGELRIKTLDETTGLWLDAGTTRSSTR